jgi:hypothetical protein
MQTYEKQESSQTLAEAMAEYYGSNPGLDDVRRMTREAADFFRCHDVAHVVFGCSTHLDHEAAVKIASILGTTAGLGVLRGYRQHESIEIYKRLRLAQMLQAFAMSVVIIPRTVLRCLRQRERWPWAEHERFLDLPLREIREQFGITVARGASPGVASLQHFK